MSPTLAAVHRILGRLAALVAVVVAASGVPIALDIAAGRSSAAGDVGSVAAVVERLARHGTLERLTRTPDGALVAQYDAPRRRISADPATGAALPLAGSSPATRLATDLHRSLGLGTDGGRIAVAAATAATLILALSGLVLLRRRPRAGGGAAMLHRVGGVALALPVVFSAATGLLLVPASLAPVAVGGLPPPFATATAATRLPPAAVTALAAVPFDTLEDLVLPRGDDAEDTYHLTTVDAFAEIDPATGQVLDARARPALHRVATAALALHAGYGRPLLAAGLGIAAAALVAELLGGLWLDAVRLRAGWRRRRPGTAGPDTLLLYGTSEGTTRAFAERLARRLERAGHRVHLAAMDDIAAAPGGAERLVVLTATAGAGTAPATAGRFLTTLTRLDRVPASFAVLGFGDSGAERYCGYADDVAAALTARGAAALLPTGRVDRRSDSDVAGWTAALMAALGHPAAAGRPDDPPPPPRRVTLSGPAMASRWTATVHAPDGVDTDALRHRLAERVATIEARLSRFRAESDVVRLDAASLGTWLDVSDDLVRVLAVALEVGRRSDGAFDAGLAAEVAAAGFGTGWAGAGVAAGAERVPAHAALDLDVAGRRVRKRAPVALDLAGVAKGYAVDELARVVEDAGIASYLVGLDGELKAGTRQPDGRAWAVGVETPAAGRRDLVGRVDLVGRAVATSGDYRRRDRLGRGHTIDPATGRPRRGGPAAVTVFADSCAAADAWATALAVAGRAGLAAARAAGASALFVEPPTAVPASGTISVTEPGRYPTASA
jgi:thiamine biosynthesis lipoprotein ApbE